MRLTTRTNLAMRVLMYCAVNDNRVVRSIDIAKACNASANHLMQVVHLLHLNGFIIAHRGRSGGLELSRPASDISIGDVFRVFEAYLPFAECFSTDDNTCPLTDHCRLRTAITAAVEAFYKSLDGTTLNDLVKDNCGLQDLLSRGLVPDVNCAQKGTQSAALDLVT